MFSLPSWRLFGVLSHPHHTNMHTLCFFSFWHSCSGGKDLAAMWSPSSIYKAEHKGLVPIILYHSCNSRWAPCSSPSPCAQVMQLIYVRWTSQWSLRNQAAVLRHERRWQGAHTLAIFETLQCTCKVQQQLEQSEQLKYWLFRRMKKSFSPSPWGWRDPLSIAQHNFYLMFHDWNACCLIKEGKILTSLDGEQGAAIFIACNKE